MCFFLKPENLIQKGEDLKDSCFLEGHDTELVVALIKYYIFVKSAGVNWI